MSNARRVLVGLVAACSLALLGTPSAAQDAAPKAYLFANLDVTDKEGMQRYAEGVSPLIARHGGAVLAAMAEPEALEGALPLKRVVVIEFPSAEAARTFLQDPEYQPLKDLRLKSAATDMVLIPGVGP